MPDAEGSAVQPYMYEEDAWLVAAAIVAKHTTLVEVAGGPGWYALQGLYQDLRLGSWG